MRRKASRRLAAMGVADEDFGESKVFCHVIMGVVSPVVEIPGDDEWSVARRPFIDSRSQRLDLFQAGAPEQGQVYANAVKRRIEKRCLDLRVQDAAFFEAEMGDILVDRVDDWKSGEDGVAVVAVVVDDVFAIGRAPDVTGQEFVLGIAGPVFVILGVFEVKSLYFLQKDNVGGEPIQLLFQLMNHHPPIELREPFVDVVGRDVQC